jgi:hypothetical protein
MVPCLSRRVPLATSRAPPKGLAGHNISPRLRKQLVLELEVGVVAVKLFQLLPCGVLVVQPAPLDAEISDPTRCSARTVVSGFGRMRPWRSGGMTPGAVGDSPR